MSVPTITTVLPSSAAALTAQAVFGPTPWLTNPTITTPAGTFPDNPAYYATQATAQLVAEIVGGTAIPVPPTMSQDQGNWMVLVPGNGVINPGLVAAFFSHGYPLSLLISMIQNEIAGAGYVAVIALSVAPPSSSAPAAPVVLVGGLITGPGQSPLYAFARGVVAGPQGGTVEGQPVNVWPNLLVDDPVAGPVVAYVVPSPIPGADTYDGWWVPVPSQTATGAVKVLPSAGD
jgi:hypothetical protein